MKKEIVYLTFQIIGLISGIIGVILIWDLKIIVGIILILFSNNIGTSTELKQKFNIKN